MSSYFGTDGIRVVVDDLLTPEMVSKIAKCFGYYLRKQNIEEPNVVIGYDTRISGPLLESAFVSGLLSVGVNVIRVGILPTPAVAFLTRMNKADAGIMISASHNPYFYNGIKFFDRNGYKILEEIELEIEELMYQFNSLVFVDITGRVISALEYSASKYIDYLTSTGFYHFEGIKIVLDCANGAAYKIAPHIFRSLGAEVVILNDTPTGININQKCGAVETGSLRQAVVEHSANLGLAFDGDADRLIAVDENGQELNGDHILYICAKEMKKAKQLKNDSIVSTIVCNIGLQIDLQKIGVSLFQTSVGDRNVMQEMKKSDSILGGESSGHIIFSHYSTTGDGILCALQLVSMTLSSGFPLSKLRNAMNIYPYVSLNFDHSGTWECEPELKKAIKMVQSELGQQGSVLVRPSGTEPIIRLLIQGPDQEKITEYADYLTEIIHSSIRENGSNIIN